jgi:hypothetical protein
VCRITYYGVYLVYFEISKRPIFYKQMEYMDKIKKTATCIAFSYTHESHLGRSWKIHELFLMNACITYVHVL